VKLSARFSVISEPRLHFVYIRDYLDYADLPNSGRENEREDKSPIGRLHLPEVTPRTNYRIKTSSSLVIDVRGQAGTDASS